MNDSDYDSKRLKLDAMEEEAIRLMSPIREALNTHDIGNNSETWMSLSMLVGCAVGAAAAETGKTETTIGNSLGYLIELMRAAAKAQFEKSTNGGVSVPPPVNLTMH